MDNIYAEYILDSVAKRRPVNAVFELTKSCNFSCIHCYLGLSGNRGSEKIKVLTTQEWKQVIEKTAAAGVIFAEVTGGEIFLRDDALELLQYMRDQGLIISVFSNGSMIDETIAHALKSMKILYIAYSLHSPDPLTQDRISGQHGSFEQIMKAVRVSKSAGLHTVIKVSVGRTNAHQLDQLITLGDQLEVPLQLGFMTLADRFGQIPGDFQVSDPEEMRPVLTKILEYNRLRKVSEDCKFKTPSEKQDFRCSALLTSFCVNSDGTVSPCPGIEYRIGNLLIDDFQKIWYNEDATRFAHRALPEKCQGCDQVKRCTPCPAYFFNLSGDFNQVQEYLCTLNKEMHEVNERYKKGR